MKSKLHNIHNALIVVFLLGLASVFHTDVFGDYSGFIAAFGGAAVGTLAAWISYLLGAGVFPTLMFAIAGYFLFGTACALPQLGVGMVIPTPLSLKMLAVEAVTSWKDLLTLIPPASHYVGPSVLPYLVGVIAGLGAMSATLRYHHREWALLPISAHALIGMGFGVRAGDHPWIGALAGGVAVMWVAYLSFRRRVLAGESTVGDPSALMRRAATGGLVMMCFALAVALAVAPLLTGSRIVARNYVNARIDVNDVPTPLAQFRSYIDTRKDDVMFTVTGLRPGSRLRLAALNDYDGIIYSIGTPNGEDGFSHPRRPISIVPPGAEEEKLTLNIDKYRGVWVPTSGELTDVVFHGPNARHLDASLAYWSYGRTAVAMEGLAKGDQVVTTQVVYPATSDKVLAGQKVAHIDLPELTGVPEKVEAFARQIAGNAKDAITAARTIEKYLHESYYSDPTSPRLGRPGHRASRIVDMLNAPQLVGDDEQYSVLMALMARSLGLPARVVVGFYPEKNSGGTLEIRGADAHAWVEIAFAESGWVPFDPTPDRDQIFNTALPKADPDPAPRVLQPPSAQKDPAQFQPEVADPVDPDQHQVSAGWGWTVVASVGGIIVLLSPLAVILLAKWYWRRALRTRADVAGQICGAWEDIVSSAHDAGYCVSAGTRRELACQLQEATNKSEEATFEFLARAADEAAFSDHVFDAEQSDKAWSLNARAHQQLAEKSPRSKIRRALSLAGWKNRRAT